MTALARFRSEPVEYLVFWGYLAGLAWVPFWYGGNDWLGWGVNAVIFPMLTGLYEFSLIVRRQSHPVAIGNLAIIAALFTAVVLWIEFQTVNWPHAWPANPIWQMAADALGHPIDGSISVSRDLTVVGLMRLLTSASVFWLALQLCRNGRRAYLLVAAIGAFSAAYALYGMLALKFGQVPWLAFMASNDGRLSSTFINPDSFATYAGIGLIAIVAMLLVFYGDALRAASGSLRLQIAAFIEQTGGQGATLLAASFITLVALLLTGSRGAAAAACFGLFVLGALSWWRDREAKAPPILYFVGLVLIVVTLVSFGGAVGTKLEQGGIYDENRFRVYLLTLRSILDAPLLGYGYGTFAAVFPMYRDHSIGVLGTWTQAHDTYLEVLQGLGLVFGAMLILCVGLIAARCFKGSLSRQRGAIVPTVAASAAALVGVHALVDFSLQIQAVSLTLMALLGAGVAQSITSRAVLQD